MKFKAKNKYCHIHSASNRNELLKCFQLFDHKETLQDFQISHITDKSCHRNALMCVCECVCVCVCACACVYTTFILWENACDHSMLNSETIYWKKSGKVNDNKVTFIKGRREKTSVKNIFHFNFSFIRILASEKFRIYFWFCLSLSFMSTLLKISVRHCSSQSNSISLKFLPINYQTFGKKGKNI